MGISKKFNKPKSLFVTQSAENNNKNAKEKFIIIVVAVKKKFGIACLNFL